ncbi:MAG: extracellular solute-binding protein [Jatrophihabitans sp.]|nr:extracellular solute-binding protein [Jatrophihabitans sp.]
MQTTKKALAVLCAATLAVGALAACSSSKSSGGSTKTSGSSAPKVNLSGKTFTVLGQWTGAEQKAFQAVLDGFKKATGATGTYTPAAGGDEATVLGTKVNGGTPPDVAMLALPGAISQYAKANKLQPLGSDAKAGVAANYASVWTQLATVGGNVYGVPFDASNKSTVWYATKPFTDAGITNPPATWADFLKSAKTLSDAGVQVPVSIGGGDGWTLTDWFENVYIRTAGLASYDKLTHHQIPWTDASVTKALTTLKELWSNQALIGSPANALKTPFPASVDNTFKASAKSAVVFEGSFVATTITGDKLPAKVGTDAKFFPFPSVDGSKPALVGGGDFAVGFTKNAAVQPFLAYLASAEAAKAIVGSPGSGFLSANKNLATSDYNDATSGELGKQIVSVGDNFRFDMSDQAPAEFGGTPNKGEWADLQTFLGNGNVAAAQKALEAHAKAAKGW